MVIFQEYLIASMVLLESYQFVVLKFYSFWSSLPIKYKKELVNDIDHLLERYVAL